MKRKEPRTPPERRSVIIRALVEAGRVGALNSRFETPKKGKGAKYDRKAEKSCADFEV